MKKFEIFLSFKNNDCYGNSTKDKEIAEKLYEVLSIKGLSVFYSNITLLELGESIYKKAIDEALDNSQVLVTIGTDLAYIESNWIEYEWESFHNDILSGLKENGRIVTYTKNVLPISLPRTLRGYQNYQMETTNIEAFSDYIEKMFVNEPKTFNNAKDNDKELDDFTILGGKEKKNSVYSSTYGNEFERLKIQAQNAYKSDKIAIDFVKENIGNKKKLTVLDIGSAFGFVAKTRFADDEQIEKVICIDINKAVIEKAKEIQDSSKMLFYVLDVESEKFEDRLKEVFSENEVEKVDIIFSALTIHHLKDPNKFLRKIRKFLNNSGYIILRGSDDGSKISHPNNEILDKIIEKCLNVTGVSDRLNGRKIYTQLTNSGYKSIRIFENMRDLSGLDFEERENLFKESFTYRIDYFKKAYERDPYNITIKNDYEWMKKALELLEDQFYDADFWYAEFDFIGVGSK